MSFFFQGRRQTYGSHMIEQVRNHECSGKIYCRELRTKAIHAHGQIGKRRNLHTANSVYREKTPVMGKRVPVKESNDVFPRLSCNVHAETLTAV